MRNRSNTKKIIDFLTFPVRALALFNDDKWGLSSLRSERFDYASKEVKGFCLDVGCGRNNLFIKKWLNNNGVGVDVFKYEGLDEKNIVKDLSHFPFKDNSFDTITFIASINHIPRKKRILEVKEAYRCLRRKGMIVITMGNPLSELMVHKLVYIYDKLFKTDFDVDSERGMHDEDYFLTDRQIIELLNEAKFKNIKKKYFPTQWFLNHLFVAFKN